MSSCIGMFFIAYNPMKYATAVQSQFAFREHFIGMMSIIIFITLFPLEQIVLQCEVSCWYWHCRVIFVMRSSRVVTQKPRSETLALWNIAWLFSDPFIPDYGARNETIFNHYFVCSGSISNAVRWSCFLPDINSAMTIVSIFLLAWCSTSPMWCN